MEELLLLLERDDHTNVPALERLYAEYGHQQGFCAAIMEAVVSGNDQLECNGSHLLYMYVKEERTIKPLPLQLLIDNLDKLQHWAGRMAVARIMGIHPDWFTPEVDAVVPVLREWCSDGNAYLRAWAIDAFARMAGQVADLRPAALEWIAEGEADEKPAVQARMRQLRAWAEDNLAVATATAAG